MKTIIANALLFFAPALLPQRTVIAIDGPSSAEPGLHCDLVREKPRESGAIFCVRHIQSFIDGLLVTDERLTWGDHYHFDRAV